MSEIKFSICNACTERDGCRIKDEYQEKVGSLLRDIESLSLDSSIGISIVCGRYKNSYIQQQVATKEENTVSALDAAIREYNKAQRFIELCGPSHSLEWFQWTAYISGLEFVIRLLKQENNRHE